MIAQIRPRDGLISDALPELMGLWRMIRDEPEKLALCYEQHWNSLQSLGHTYFYDVRDDFNKTRDPAALLFLSRTCVNGLIRFNSKGDFNNSLHHTRPGIRPDSLSTIVHQWSGFVSGLEIDACDYEEALGHAEAGDFAFLDPPYAGNRGRYMPEKFDLSRFGGVLEDLTRRGVHWLLTLDGTAGDRDYAASLPPVPAMTQFTVATGHSPFTRLMKSSLDEVLESVYLNYDPIAETTS